MSATSTATTNATADPRRWTALMLLALADFVVVLDATIMNIALPSVGRALHASTSELSWVITAYILAFGGLLMLGGKLADLYGRRRLFIGGLVLFGVASLFGGLSTSIEQLILFRALQGAGAAALAPAARSFVTVLFEEGPERSKALGIWAAVAGSGSVVGLILGGVLTSAFGWEWVLFINVPITLGAAALAPKLLSESRADSDSRSVDVGGAILSTSALVAALYALVNANDAGWGSLQTLGLLGAAALLLILFVRVESRAVSPLVPLSIFRLPQVRGANIAMVLMAAAMVGMFFILALYQQQLQGYSALESGVSQLPLGLVLITVAGLAGPFTERVGPRRVLVTGTALVALGVAWLSRLPLQGSYLGDILGPSLVIAIGLGLAFVALTIASTAGVHPEHAGIAGGLINMTQQVGGALGLAVITAVATSGLHGATHGAASVDSGFRAALIVAAGIAAAASVLGGLVLAGQKRPTPAVQAAVTESAC